MRRGKVPTTKKPNMATQNPDPPPTWFSCNHCSQLFIRRRNVRGVVALLGDRYPGYYVTENITSVFYMNYFGITSYKGIRGANLPTYLDLTRIFCSSCTQPAGWRVVGRSQSHPIVDVGHFLQPVRPALPPPPPPPPPPRGGGGGGQT